MGARDRAEAAKMVELSRHLADQHGVWFTKPQLQRETLQTLEQRHAREHEQLREAGDYGPQPGLNDLAAWRLDDAPQPNAKPHRIAETGDHASGQAECHDCGWHTLPGVPDYHEQAERHRDATR